MSRVRTIAVLFWVLMLIGISATAQVTVNEFLGSALDDYEVQTFRSQMTYLDGKPYRQSPIREVEFRTQNREMMRTQQEFGLRISPSNPFELRSQNEYFRQVNSALAFDREFALKEALLVRYLTVVEYCYFSDRLALNSTATRNLEENLLIMEKQSGSRYFDAEDFVDLKIDHLDHTVEVEETRFELASQAHFIARTYTKAHQREINWGFDNLIPVDKVSRVVDSIEQLSIKTSWVAYQEQKIRVAKSHYQLEKNNYNIGFIQGSFDFRRYNQDRNPFVISAGLTLPITNPNKGDMARRKLDVIEAEYDLQEEIIEAGTDRVVLSDNVRGLAARLASIENRIAELRESDLPRTLSSIRDGDPAVLIQFAQNLDKLQALALKVKRELFISYVEYLAFMDLLQKEPLTNFLSPGLSPVPGR